MKILKTILAERSMGKKNDERSAFSHACSQTGFRPLPPFPETQHPSRARTAPMCVSARCSCHLHSSWHLRKVPSLAPFSNLGSFFSEVQGRIPSLIKAWLSLTMCIVIKFSRRLHQCYAKPKGALKSQLPTSTTRSTAQHYRQSKAGGVWKRPERLSMLLGSYWLTALLVILFVGIQRGKAGPCMKAWTICIWKLLHLLRIQWTVWRIQTEKKSKKIKTVK